MLKLAAVVLLVVAASAKMAVESEFKDEFELWQSLFKKEYKTMEEEITRFAVWMNNLRIVSQHNLEADLGMHTYTLGMNEYSDMTIEQVRQNMNGFLGYLNKNKTVVGQPFVLLKYPQLPDTVDWRDHDGYVSEVKNQGQCGSCWAFSTTGSLEGQHFKKTGEKADLSEQNLVDCSLSYGNHGCEGGLMDYGFQYVKDNGGIDTETSYPYEAEDDTCRYNKNTIGATDKGFVDVTQGDEDALKQAVATVGPISVAIDASHMSFQSYNGGVYVEPECSSEQLDHGVLVVGYGTAEDGQDYWLVKNSWGPEWGEKGYIKMGRNMNNQCGIASSASYPKV